MSTETNRIPIEEADLATLKHFAELALGLEIKAGTNATNVRAKIQQAMPDCTSVPELPKAPEPIVAIPEPAEAAAAPAAPKATPAPASQRQSYSVHRPLDDPRVRLRIHKTDDKRRSKDVTVSVNGFVWRMQRGVEIDLSYRAYLALEDAKEKVAVDTDRINPFTGDPIKSWEEVHSYPFTVIRMPPQEEIDRWLIETSGSDVQAAA